LTPEQEEKLDLVLTKMQDVEEILDFIKTARKGRQVLEAFIVWMFKFLYFLAKLVAAAAFIWGVVTAVKNGKPPDLGIKIP